MPVSNKTLYKRSLEIGLDVDFAAKSLANIVFREVIEDIHSKYITDEEMKELNRRVVNRAAAFLGCVGNDELLASLTAMYSYGTYEWDEPEETEEIQRIMAEANKYADRLRSCKDGVKKDGLVTV